MDYADRKSLDPALADAVWSVIRLMDSAEREWHFENWKAERGGA